MVWIVDLRLLVGAAAGLALLRRWSVAGSSHSAKLGDFLFWAYFRDTETFDEPVNVYLEIYEIDHPAFKRCAKLHVH